MRRCNVILIDTAGRSQRDEVENAPSLDEPPAADLRTTGAQIIHCHPTCAVVGGNGSRKDLGIRILAGVVAEPPGVGDLRIVGAGQVERG